MTSDLKFESSIKSFYENQNILITGGTGFLGKVLVEKILYSCNVKAIYLIIRDKRNISSEQRYKDYINHKIFERIQNECPEVLSKIVNISGDLFQPNLGISEEDTNMILNTINIVFHSAATVRFNEKLNIAMSVNVTGTENILKLCTQMKNLKSIVHISTAYVQPKSNNKLMEKIYPLECPIDKYKVLEMVRTMPKEEFESFFDEIRGKHFFTYSFTKAIAESIVADYHQNHSLPLAIIRPSLILGSQKEPKPGWNDNFQVMNILSIEVGRGTLHSIPFDENSEADMIPVDVVVNTMLAAAWKINNNNKLNDSKDLLIYNCVSSEFKMFPISFILRCAEKFFRKNSTKYQIMKPFIIFTTNRFLHSVVSFISLLALNSLDFILRILKKPAFNANIFQRTLDLLDLVEPVMTNIWTFDCTNYLNLIQEIKQNVDAKVFEIDLTVINAYEFNENLLKNCPNY